MKATILNTGDAAWVFEAHAQRLAQAFGTEVSEFPASFNYVLGWDGKDLPQGRSFIPLESIRLASDKRILAERFASHGVATPRTYLLDTEAEVHEMVSAAEPTEWVLKWPIGCGATGHQLIVKGTTIPSDWPRPFVLQEFIRLEIPEVYRLYCVSGETFGWNARRFPTGSKTSPFVAHALGARYEAEEQVPVEAMEQAERALQATCLFDSFGCADLMRNAAGEWLVLEVNTDGIFNHVDRDIDIGDIAGEIDRRLAEAFRAWCGENP